MVNIMTVGSREEMEALLKEVLEAQKSLLSFIRSKSDSPAAAALALYTAAYLILDDCEEGSETDKHILDMMPRMLAIVDLGYESVLEALRKGKYQDVFSLSVEIGAQDLSQDNEDEYEGELVDDVDRSTLN